MTYLTSFPRSGCTVLALALEAWTGRPITGAELRPWSISNTAKIGLPVDESLPPVLSMSHRPAEWTARDDKKTAHTLLHRHALEACVSFWLGQFKIPLEEGLARLNGGEVPQELKAFIDEHSEGIRLHRAWKGPRYWIEYDDLIRDPISVLHYLESATSRDKDRALDFCANYKEYLDALLAWKRTRPLPIWTGGDNLMFFRARLSEEAKRTLYPQ